MTASRGPVVRKDSDPVYYNNSNVTNDCSIEYIARRVSAA